jgi:hypothetical protein
MTDTLEPREVEQPFIRRWLVSAFELCYRAPVRFCAVIAILAALDALLESLSTGYTVSQFWLYRVGDFLLPTLWMMVCVLARGADRGRNLRDSLSMLPPAQAWTQALSAGALLVGVSVVLGLMFGKTPLPGRVDRTISVVHEGDFALLISRDAMMLLIYFGNCYCPLLALAPPTALKEARWLSKRGAELNQQFHVWFLYMIPLLIAYALTSYAPTFGIPVHVFLVFFGVLNYVAYRDIFERRATNSPVATAGATRAADARLRVTS